MNFFKKVMPLALGLLIMAGSVFGQVQQQQQPQTLSSEDVTDEELESFVATAMAIQTLRQQAQAQLQQIVQDEGLEFQRFQLIMMSKQNPQVADSLTVTAEEEEAMTTIQAEMQKLNQNMMPKFQSAIEENGLTQQRFQQIAQALQSDTELQERFKKMQAEQMQSGGADSNS